jgi:hypothetical protein
MLNQFFWYFMERPDFCKQFTNHNIDGFCISTAFYMFHVKMKLMYSSTLVYYIFQTDYINQKAHGFVK